MNIEKTNAVLERAIMAFQSVEIEQLAEAKYSVDSAARKKANKVWDSIIAYVKSQADDNFSSLPADSSTGGVIIHPRHTKLPTNVKVILTPDISSDSGGSFTSFHGGYIIFINGAMKGRGDREYLDTRLTSPRLRRVFIHEYTHAMDQQRNPALFKIGGRAANQYRAGHPTAYVQNAVEFNALFHEVAQEVEDRIGSKLAFVKRTAGKRRNRKFAEQILAKLQGEFASFPVFIKTDTYSGAAEDIADIVKGSKWERKWLKRMHGLYRGLKARVDAVKLPPLHAV